ncbi:MAG TPA: hypothetical protein VET51_10055 [Burkholderiales bacterium]|nr:hypothetical protein [Burkholderiales bacterium]
MGIGLIVVSLLLAVAAAIMFVASRGTLHEMEAFILWLIASVLFTGGAIVLALAQLRHRLDQLVKPSEDR